MSRSSKQHAGRLTGNLGQERYEMNEEELGLGQKGDERLYEQELKMVKESKTPVNEQELGIV